MKKIKIITDSCSDLGRDLLDKYDIDYAAMNTVCGGKESIASLDWESYTPSELYGTMRRGERVTTTQVPVSEFDRIFRKYLALDMDIVYIGCSGALSGSVNTGRIVAEGLKTEYHDATIICIDATNSALGEGLLAVRAATLRDEGKTVDEIAAVIEDEKHYVNQFCTVDSLDMLKKAGRVKGSAAFFGNLFGVKPIIISDYNGQNVPIKKVKGRKTSLDEVVNLLKEAMDGNCDQTVYIGHADCAEDAEYLKQKVAEEINPTDIYVNYIGPIIGASIGPGAVVLFAMGKKVETAV